MVLRHSWLRTFGFCLLLAATGACLTSPMRGDEPLPPQEARKPKKERKPNEEQKPQEVADDLSMLMSRVTGMMLSSHLQRDDRTVRSAFREVVAQARPFTVRVFAGDDQVALGTVVDADGFVLTKSSELYGKLSCKLADGRQLPAQIVGVEKESDLAMLRIDAKDLPVVKWGNEQSMAVGNWLATPAHDDLPAAIGVLSNTPRKVIAPSGALGVMLDINQANATINDVMPHSGAERAGLKSNDVITHINGVEVSTRQALVESVQKHQPGVILEVKVKRGNEPLTVKVTLGDRAIGPSSERAALQNSLGGRLSERRGGFPVVLQHDTVLRPNQCGGPVVNLDGQAVGVNIARAGRVASYALPASVVLPLLEELKSGRLAPEASTMTTTAAVTEKPEQ